MTAIGWLLLLIGIGIIYEAWHGKNIWHDITDLLSGYTQAGNTATK